MSDLASLSPGQFGGYGGSGLYASACGDKGLYGGGSGWGAGPAPYGVGAGTAAGFMAMNSFVLFLIWFIIIWVIVWVILWLVKPSWIMRPSLAGPEVDYGKLFLWSFIISLIVIFLIWLLKSCSGGKTW